MNRRRLGALLIVAGIALGGLGGAAGAQEVTTTTVEASTTTEPPTTVAPTTTTTTAGFNLDVANRRDFAGFAGTVVFGLGLIAGLLVLR